MDLRKDHQWVRRETGTRVSVSSKIATCPRKGREVVSEIRDCGLAKAMTNDANIGDRHVLLFEPLIP